MRASIAIPTDEHLLLRLHVRFWNMVDMSGECWRWTRSVNSKGYGQIKVGEVVEQAHRVAFLLNNGQIPDGLHICHHCDNPPCVRPDHLYAATNTQNQRDAWARNRFQNRRGERTSNVKLTAEEVVQIRKLYAAGGVSHSALSHRFNVSKNTIGCVLRREVWGHV